MDVTTMETAELEALLTTIQTELASRRAADEPVMRRIVCRRKDLNSRGNGEQETRRVRLPDGSTGWASDLAQDVTGSWHSGSYRAHERRCAERGYFPVGTIVVAFDSSVRGGRTDGRATISAAVVPAPGEDLDWSLSTRGRGDDLEVKTPEGEWVSI